VELRSPTQRRDQAGGGGSSRDDTQCPAYVTTGPRLRQADPLLPRLLMAHQTGVPGGLDTPPRVIPLHLIDRGLLRPEQPRRQLTQLDTHLGLLSPAEAVGRTRP
jgi:hypothetical protein